MDEIETAASGGHLFIIDGDLQQLHCDAWLLPTDADYNVTPAFAKVFGQANSCTVPAERRGTWSAGMHLAFRASRASEPDIWIGDIGGTPSTPEEHFAERARSFVGQAAKFAAARLERGDRSWSRPPIVALGVIGSGAGGHRSKRGPLLQKLIPALLDAARERACDVVLVTYGQVMYTAAQKVRRESAVRDRRYWAGLPDSLCETADRLAETARSQRLVTFFGAGVGSDVGRPTWSELLESIALRSGAFTPQSIAALGKLDPRDQATVIQRKAGTGFKPAVEASLATERYSLTHGLLASLPVNESVTTNFDDLYERAARIAGRSLAVFPGDDLTAGQRWLLKLHGTIGKDMVLTRDEYLGAMSSHVALRGLVQAMLFTRTMLFVGYSLRDEDFHQLVHEVRSALGDVKPKSMGAVLMIDAVPHLEVLWPELEIIAMPDHSPAVDRAGAARRLTIFLDRLGASAASDTLFVADDTMGDLRSDEELELAKIVATLRRLYDEPGVDRKRWATVETFLESFKDPLTPPDPKGSKGSPTT